MAPVKVMGNALAILNILGSFVIRVRSDTMNLLEMKTNFFVHLVMMPVLKAQDVLALARKVSLEIFVFKIIFAVLFFNLLNQIMLQN